MIRTLRTAALATVLSAAWAMPLAAQQTPRSPGTDAVASRAGTYVIRNATIVPVVGARIPNGSVVVQNGRIAAVGANVQAPAGATVIDATGMFVFPGMIDGGTALGLTEIGSVPGPIDTREIGDFNPQNDAIVAVNASSELIPVTRVNGVTTAITGMEGGLVNGTAALIDLEGWVPNEMAAKPQAAMVMSYPSLGGGGFGGFGGGFGQQRSMAERREAQSRQVRELRAYLSDAKAYAEVRGRNGNRAPGRVNQAMEAMIPVVRGELPVIFDVEAADQIRGVLSLADSFGIKPVLRGAREAWMLADTLAARRIPVIVGPLTQVPGGSDPYDMLFANPAALVRAGVKIAFQTGDAAESRNLPYNAGLAVGFGLSADEAMKALTINAAEIFGVADRYGSIEPGKVANLFVANGEILDTRTQVRHVFIRGAPLPMNDRHTELYERYRARPKP